MHFDIPIVDATSVHTDYSKFSVTTMIGPSYSLASPLCFIRGYNLIVVGLYNSSSNSLARKKN